MLQILICLLTIVLRQEPQTPSTKYYNTNTASETTTEIDTVTESQSVHTSLDTSPNQDIDNLPEHTLSSLQELNHLNYIKRHPNDIFYSPNYRKCVWHIRLRTGKNTKNNPIYCLSV